jgi:hypothetical protein
MVDKKRMNDGTIAEFGPETGEIGMAGLRYYGES